MKDMEEQTHEDPSVEGSEEVSVSRLQLIWDVLLFQVKLAADGIKDILLVPLSLIAAFMGLVAGGKRPDQYFRRLLIAGRRVERWVNLFGHRQGDTSDKMVAPFQQKVFDELERQPWLKEAGTQFNRHLDEVNDSIEAHRREERARNAGEPPTSER